MILIQQKATQFVNEVKDFIQEHKLSPDQIMNADQSRFDKELRAGRTLSFKGNKTIFGVMGSVVGTTHYDNESYCDGWYVTSTHVCSRLGAQWTFPSYYDTLITECERICKQISEHDKT